MFGETSEQKAARKDMQSRTLSAAHVSGLPLEQGVNCTLVFEEDNLTIKTVEVNCTSFRVAFNKIVNLQVQTTTDVQNTMVSSAGGAVAGAMLFGAAGAMIAGRAKQKQVRTKTYYFTVTYTKDSNLEYLRFTLWGDGEYLRANKMLKKYLPLVAGGTSTIEL